MNKFNQLLETYLTGLKEKKDPKMFSPTERINYVFEDPRAGTLSEDERTILNAVDLGSTYTGKDLLDYLKDEIKFEPREDLNVSKLRRLLTGLLDKGVLVASQTAREEDEIPALDTMDDDTLNFGSEEDVQTAIDPSFKKTPRYGEF